MKGGNVYSTANQKLSTQGLHTFTKPPANHVYIQYKCVLISQNFIKVSMFYLFSCTALHFRVSSNPKVCANNLLANQLRYLVFIFVKYKHKKKKSN